MIDGLDKSLDRRGFLGAAAARVAALTTAILGVARIARADACGCGIQEIEGCCLCNSDTGYGCVSQCQTQGGVMWQWDHCIECYQSYEHYGPSCDNCQYTLCSTGSCF